MPHRGIAGAERRGSSTFLSMLSLTFADPAVTRRVDPEAATYCACASGLG
jgi:hypothetical protein